VKAEGRLKKVERLGDFVRVRTGKLDANASSGDGAYPFFTCSEQPLRIASFSYDCECVLVAGNGDLNVKYYKGKFDAYQRTYIIESTDAQALDVRFLFHFMSVYVKQLRAMSIGGVIKYIKLGYLTDARIPLPPLAEQRRIAEVLDRAEALRVKRRAALAQLDSLPQSLFLDLFGDPVTNPKRWPIRRIGELLESASYGTSEKSGTTGGFPVLRMNNIARTGEMDFTDLKFMDLEASQCDRYLVRTGDLLFNRTNSVDLVGKTGVYRETKPMAYAGYLIRLRVNKENDPEFLSAFLNSGYSKRMLRGMCKSIIGMANINATEIQAMRIPQPPLPLQGEFARRVTAVEKLKTAQRASLAELDALFATLQHRAFRGEL
jgi:type I restriction enzyme, S subunit